VAILIAIIKFLLVLEVIYHSQVTEISLLEFKINLYLYKEMFILESSKALLSGKRAMDYLLTALRAAAETTRREEPCGLQADVGRQAGGRAGARREQAALGPAGARQTAGGLACYLAEAPPAHPLAQERVGPTESQDEAAPTGRGLDARGSGGAGG